MYAKKWDPRFVLSMEFTRLILHVWLWSAPSRAVTNQAHWEAGSAWSILSSPRCGRPATRPFRLALGRLASGPNSSLIVPQRYLFSVPSSIPTPAETEI